MGHAHTYQEPNINTVVTSRGVTMLRNVPKTCQHREKHFARIGYSFCLQKEKSNAQLAEHSRVVQRGVRDPAWAAYGDKRFGSRVNMVHLRMLSNPKNNITTRSKPMPPPPCGNAPCLNASTYP